MSGDLRTILLIDPSTESRALHADALRRDGFNVVAVADCDVALKVLTAPTLPQLIVTSFDIHTREECLAFCERLNSDVRTRTVPVLLTSEYIDRDDMVRATDLRVLTVTVAPRDGAKLTGAVRGVLAVGEERRSA